MRSSKKGRKRILGEYRRESSDDSSDENQDTDDIISDIMKTPVALLGETSSATNKGETPLGDEITEETIAKIRDVIGGGGRPLPTRWSDIPEYLYQKGSKRCNAAKQFIDGEHDIKVLSKDNDLTEGTIYNIRSDIRGVIDEIKKQKGIKTTDEKQEMRRTDEKGDEDDDDDDDDDEDDDETMRQMRNDGPIVVRAKVDEGIFAKDEKNVHHNEQSHVSSNVSSQVSSEKSW